MLRSLLCPTLFLPALLILPVHLTAQDGDPLESVYVVNEYDVDRDPAEDLAAAVARAQPDGKRILLEIGGEWCGWCHRLDLFIREHPAIVEALAGGYLVIKVNMSPENKNEEFLGQYPRIPGYPHIFVLEADGSLLHSQGTAALEEGMSYNEAAILEFLNAWAPGGGEGSSSGRR